MANQGYVREDAAEKMGQALGNSVGRAASVGLAGGPLAGLVAGGTQFGAQGGHIKKKEKRELREIEQSYRQLLTQAQVEVNNRRGKLISENDIAPTLFVTPSHWKSLMKALAIDDPAAQVSALRAVCAQSPAFREAQYWLANALHRTGNIPEAVRICTTLAAKSNPILQRDEFRGRVQATLGSYLLQQGNLEESLAWSKASLGDKPENAEAYKNITEALIGLERYMEACESWAKYNELQPNSAWCWWTGARLAAAVITREDPLSLLLLRIALAKGVRRS